ncbi:MAG TPA: MFS transporter [Elusimicrobiota bacterium]|jgi:MFS family permease|nr:MFS transporter [Elusimicrobiota bacterium]
MVADFTTGVGTPDLVQYPMLAVLTDKNAARLFVGQLVSQVCDKMMTVGLIWVLTQRASLAAIPWFLAVSALPHLLLAWRAGHWTNLLGPLKTVIWADWIRAAIFAGLAFAWPRVPPGAELAVLFAASFAANFASALFNPAMMSLPLHLGDAEVLQQLTAVLDSCFSLGSIVGPVCSALLYPWIGLRGLFLFNGLSFAFAAILESGVLTRLPASAEEAAGAAGSAASGMGELLRGDSLLRFMLGGFLGMNIFFGPLLVFLPLFAKAAYGGTIGTLASLETSLGAGTALGGVILTLVRFDSRTGVKISAGMGLMAVSYVAFTLTRVPWQGCACLAALGFFLATANVFILNLFQTRPAPRDVPTVMSLVNLISTASLPVSMGVLGLLVGRVEVRSLALACSCMLLLATAILVSSRELRQV